MKKKRFNEVQIIGVLKEYAAGIPATDLARKLSKDLIVLTAKLF